MYSIAVLHSCFVECVESYFDIYPKKIRVCLVYSWQIMMNEKETFFFLILELENHVKIKCYST